MTRKDIINEAAKKTGLTKKAVDKVVRAIFDGEDGILITSMLEGEEIKISGFGKFFMRKREEGLKKNPFGKESFMIPSRLYLKFESSRTLRTRLRDR